MKERPILFSGPMVRAILHGTKTQTRRVIKPQPWYLPEAYDRFAGWMWTRTGDGDGTGLAWGSEVAPEQVSEPLSVYCPYGAPGDLLWVRETWRVNGNEHDYAMAGPDKVFYRADEDWNADAGWRPSILMPRWASRITLEVTSVRVQRLQDISHEDGKAEGFDSLDGFALLWDRINEKRGYGWHANPWVWAVEFRAVKA